MSNGWIKVHRDILNSMAGYNCEMLGFFTYLLLRANHFGKFVTNKGVELKEGQLATGRKQLASDTQLTESKVERLLKKLVKSEIIEQQTFSKYRIITITNWLSYQAVGQQTDSKRTATIQQADTIQEEKKKRREEEKVGVPVLKTQTIEVIEYFNLVTGKKYKTTDATAARVIISLLKESYTVQDFKHVIDVKYEEWGEQAEYESRIRPLTFFAYEKFSSYLNQTSESQIEHEREMRLAKILGVTL